MYFFPIFAAETKSNDMESATFHTKSFQSRLDEEADRLWDEGILNQEKLDELRHTDLHARRYPF